MRKVFEHDRVACWEVDGDFYVYGVTVGGDPRVCHSEGAARAIAAGGR